MEYFSLEKFPCPKTKEFIQNMQRIFELFYSLNQHNFQDVLNELTPLVTNTPDS